MPRVGSALQTAKHRSGGLHRQGFALGSLIALAATIVLAASASAKSSGSTYSSKRDPYVQQAELIPTDEIGNALTGRSVALSSKGNIALVGGPSDGEEVGAAWVFIRRG